MRVLPVAVDPFPHAIVDGWWEPDLIAEVAAEVPAPDHAGWLRYDSGHERKMEGPPEMWGPRTTDLLAQIGHATPVLEEAFAIPDLTMETVGGGYHLIAPGGHLDIHTDFSRSSRTRLYRRLNLMVYLNPDWTEPGGQLELWDETRMVCSVAPEMNRTVVFATSATSWHGHPRPADRWRASVAAYFFSPHPPEGFVEQSTEWRAR